MSTFGKVLVVLVLLMIPVWVVLIATVAQLNKNWAIEIDKLQGQVVKLEQEVEAAEREIVAIRDEIGHVQVALGEELAAKRSQQAGLEEARSEHLEIAARLKNLQATSEAAQKSAEENRVRRDAERKAEKTELGEKQEEVKALQKVNTVQMEELQKLRDEFKKTFQANRAKVGHAVKISK